MASQLSVRPSAAPFRPSLPTVDGWLLDRLPDALVVVDLTGCVVYVNELFANLVGASAAGLIGAPFLDVLAETDILHVIGLDETLMQGATQDLNMTFMTKSGDARTLVVNSTLIPEREVVVLIARNAHALQRELADTTRWAAGERERADALNRALEELAEKNQQLELARAELESAYSQLQSEVAVRERLEDELRLAQKLEAIGHLAAGVAHEINTPLQYIGDNVDFVGQAMSRLTSHLSGLDALVDEHRVAIPTDVLEAYVELKKRNRLDFLFEGIPAALEQTATGVAHVTRIVRAMKSFAHQDRGDKVLVDINQSLRDTLTISQNEYKHVAQVELQLAELPLIYGYGGGLNQVFLNLIVNAAHAIADAKREHGRIRVATSECEAGVEVRISDNGTGIPEQIRTKLFDPFFTTKAVGRGTGQGLPMVRKLVVDAHGGAIDFETEVDVGTTFRVWLPVGSSTGTVASAGVDQPPPA